MRTDKMSEEISRQCMKRNEINKEESVIEYIVFNECTNHEYMRTRCEVVARGCYNRMKSKHGIHVRMKIESQ